MVARWLASTDRPRTDLLVIVRHEKGPSRRTEPSSTGLDPLASALDGAGARHNEHDVRRDADTVGFDGAVSASWRVGVTRTVHSQIPARPVEGYIPQLSLARRQHHATFDNAIDANEQFDTARLFARDVTAIIGGHTVGTSGIFLGGEAAAMDFYLWQMSHAFRAQPLIEAVVIAVEDEGGEIVRAVVFVEQPAHRQLSVADVVVFPGFNRVGHERYSLQGSDRNDLYNYIIYKSICQ